MKDIWRTLAPQGILIDLRPLNGNSKIEVVTGEQIQFAGLVDETVDIPNDTMAGNALARSVSKGWFIRERQASFNYVMYWDSVDEMKAYTEEKWSTSFVPKAVLATARHLMAIGNGATRVSVRYEMTIGRYRKQ